MAFVPDEAIERATELQPTAWLLYCHLCKRRNHTTQQAYARFEHLQAILGVSRSSLYQALGQLEKMAWTRRNGPIHWLLVGDFGPVNRQRIESIFLDRASDNPDRKSRNLDARKRNNQPSLPAGNYQRQEPAAPNIDEGTAQKKFLDLSDPKKFNEILDQISAARALYGSAGIDGSVYKSHLSPADWQRVTEWFQVH